MAGFKNVHKRFVYKHPDWEDGSQWVFRAEKAGKDDDVIQGMATEVVLGDVNRKELRLAAKRGEDIEDLIAGSVTQKTKMSIRNATLMHMSLEWSGPDFTVPEDFTDESDSTHELAGQVPPITEEWVGLRDGDELDEILRALNAQWSGRSAEEAETFPHAVAHPHRPKVKSRAAS